MKKSPIAQDDKKILPIKVPRIIVDQFQSIQEEEGFGNRAATFTFLVKFYRQKKQTEYDRVIDSLDKILSKIDKKKIPSLKKQLGL